MLYKNLSNSFAAAFAAIVSAAIFVGASVAPATNTVASLII